MLNAKLKAALKRQLQMHKALSGLLTTNKSLDPELFTDNNHSGSQQEVDRDVQPLVLDDDDLMSPTESKLLEQLHEQLQQMYLIAGLMVDHQSQTEISQMSSTASSSMTTDAGGMHIEFRTETSLRCSFQEAGRTMWQRIHYQETIAHPGKYALEVKPSTLEVFVYCLWWWS